MIKLTGAGTSLPLRKASAQAFGPPLRPSTPYLNDSGRKLCIQIPTKVVRYHQNCLPWLCHGLVFWCQILSVGSVSHTTRAGLKHANLQSAPCANCTISCFRLCAWSGHVWLMCRFACVRRGISVINFGPSDEHPHGATQTSFLLLMRAGHARRRGNRTWWGLSVGAQPWENEVPRPFSLRALQER
jgi:hypothetical protein